MDENLATQSLDLHDRFDREIEQAKRQIEGLEKRVAVMIDARAALIEVIKYEQNRD